MMCHGFKISETEKEEMMEFDSVQSSWPCFYLLAELLGVILLSLANLHPLEQEGGGEKRRGREKMREEIELG